MHIQLLSGTRKSNKSLGLKGFVKWSGRRAFCLTSEMFEGCVRLQVEAFPILVEGLHTEQPGLLYGSGSYFGHHSIDIMAPTNL